MASQGKPRNDVAAAVDALRRLVQALRASSVAAERRSGLSGAQLFVLEQLAEAPAASLNELAARTLTHQSSVSVVVSRLVKRGLVARATDRSDARRRVIELTPGGRALLRSAPETFQAQLISALTGLPASERKLVSRGLAIIVERLGLQRAPAPLFLETPRRGSPRRGTP
jgi:DNA-binding MarR family transcriptional regulator